ncbi:MAG: carboxy-S-adenosyl-L-methionine synthase CmoA [Oligoflexales bacterium]
MTSPTDSLVLFKNEDDLFLTEKFPHPFRFDQEVAAVFDDMARRSIPLYEDVTKTCVFWALRYYQPNTAIYDVGCSTGTTLDLISRNLQIPAHFFGVDNSEAMIEKASEKLKNVPPRHELQLLCEDVTTTKFKRSSVVIVNYTMQFLPINERQILFKRIYESLVPGGILILSEKVVSSSAQVQETFNQIYYQYKMAKGYSKREIERKKESLENILIPLPESQYREMLLAAGFAHAESVVRWNNFVSMIAIKNP